MSQSLFYWNPFCNNKELIILSKDKEVAILILLESFLQYINIDNVDNDLKVAILILLESFLQFKTKKEFTNTVKCRNPYFIGILSAILRLFILNLIENESQSLFYWNPFCNQYLIA